MRSRRLLQKAAEAAAVGSAAPRRRRWAKCKARTEVCWKSGWGWAATAGEVSPREVKRWKDKCSGGQTLPNSVLSGDISVKKRGKKVYNSSLTWAIDIQSQFGKLSRSVRHIDEKILEHLCVYQKKKKRKKDKKKDCWPKSWMGLKIISLSNNQQQTKDKAHW